MEPFFGLDLRLVNRAVERGSEMGADASFYRALADTPYTIFETIVPIVCHLNAIAENQLDIKNTPTDEQLAKFRQWISGLGHHVYGSIEHYIHFEITTREEPHKTREELEDLHLLFEARIPDVINEKIRKLGIYPEEMSAVNKRFKLGHNYILGEKGQSYLSFDTKDCTDGKVFADTVDLIVVQRRFFNELKRRAIVIK